MLIIINIQETDNFVQICYHPLGVKFYVTKLTSVLQLRGNLNSTIFLPSCFFNVKANFATFSMCQCVLEFCLKHPGLESVNHEKIYDRSKSFYII